MGALRESLGELQLSSFKRRVGGKDTVVTVTKKMSRMSSKIPLPLVAMDWDEFNSAGGGVAAGFCDEGVRFIWFTKEFVSVFTLWSYCMRL